MIYAICKFFLLLFCRPYFKVKGLGIENIPVKGGVLLISNHASYLDPPLISMLAPRPCNFLAKKSLFKIPPIAWFFHSINVKPIKRNSIDRKGLAKCRELLSNGEILIIFPEGTRTSDGELGKFKPGPIMLVDGLPDVFILPVYIDGSFNAMPRGKLFPGRSQITISYGVPFKLPEKGVAMSRKTYYKTTSNLFFEKINSLKKSNMDE
jgi:1-acyl-sn-glycerol-3-phosphate acyltransferase